MQKSNPQLRKMILQVVDNQLKANDPPETKKTLQRLIAQGYSEKESKELIASVISAHIYDTLKEQLSFDESRYIKDLNKLPKLPWE